MKHVMEPEFEDLKNPMIAYIAIQATMHETWGGEDYFDQVGHYFSNEILNEFADYLIEQNVLSQEDKKAMMNERYKELLDIPNFLEDKYTEVDTDETWEANRDFRTNIWDKVYYYFANYISQKDRDTLLTFQHTIHEDAPCQWDTKDWLFWTEEYYRLKNTSYIGEKIE